MGGGSGLLCLRTTVALRIRVPPTFHPGPQLPTTAHGARPAPAHHGPAPRAICLLGQTTPLLSPPSQCCVFASLLLRHATRIPKPRKQAQQLHGCYMLLFGALERQKEFEEMIQGEEGEPNAFKPIRQEVGVMIYLCCFYTMCGGQFGITTSFFFLSLKDRF